MSTQSQTIMELLSLETVQKLAMPANFRYGQAIFTRRGVQFIKHEDKAVEGWVGGLDGGMAEGGGQRRRTALTASEKGLSWHCAGNPKNHQVFCKHCVALALAIMEKNSDKQK